MRPANARPLPAGRDDEVDELLCALQVWAADRADLRAVALVGSWARGSAHAHSDVDIVLLTETPRVYVDDAAWARTLGAVKVLRTQRWGVLTERRMALAGGLVVEFGIVTAAWASTTPLDDGTAHVVTGGLIALYDPTGLLSELVEAVAARRGQASEEDGPDHQGDRADQDDRGDERERPLVRIEDRAAGSHRPAPESSPHGRQS